MSTWKIAGVQMDCRLGDKQANLNTMQSRLRQAAGQGARLIVFPECALPGYCFQSKEEAWPHAETLPGPSTETMTEVCRQLGVWAVYGLLEKDGERLFNVCALVGPQGYVASYRKLHLPFLGVDRFATKGDRPLQVHELSHEGSALRVGLSICYDGAFPEVARIYNLLGADLVVLPTNWPPGASKAVQYLIPARALENHIYFAAVNRVGEEDGFRFIGQSRILDPSAELLASADADEAILYAEIEPERARDKRIVWIKGQYELDRLRDRRPEMYRSIADCPKVKRAFDHVGIITLEPHDGESWVEPSQVWVTNPRLHPSRIEYIRPRQLPDIPRENLGLWKLWHWPHLAYRVEDLREAIRGQEVVLGPFDPGGGFGEVAFIHQDGLIIEYLQYRDLTHWFGQPNPPGFEHLPYPV